MLYLTEIAFCGFQVRASELMAPSQSTAASVACEHPSSLLRRSQHPSLTGTNGMCPRVNYASHIATPFYNNNQLIFYKVIIDTNKIIAVTYITWENKN